MAKTLKRIVITTLIIPILIFIACNPEDNNDPQDQPYVNTFGDFVFFDNAIYLFNSAGRTWRLNTQSYTWTELTEQSADKPSNRIGFSLVYGGSSKLILFGGFTQDNTMWFADTWEYDITTHTWTDVSSLSTATPSARCYIAMANTGESTILMHGGEFGVYGTDSFHTFEELWMYDVASHQWTNITDEGNPPGNHHAMASTGDNEVIVIPNWTSTPTAETWKYSTLLSAWSLISTTGTLSPKRFGFAMAVDPVAGTIILYGGANSQDNALLNDTWEFNCSSNTWTNLEPNGTLPPCRRDHEMAYVGDGKIIMLGGCDNSQLVDSKVWEYDTQDNTWSEKSYTIE